LFALIHKLAIKQCGPERYCPIVAMEQIMTPDFVDGILVALMPSMLMVAWLAWRAPVIDSDF
jgi:hypothetical protein